MAKLSVPILALFLCACSSDDDDAANASFGEMPRDAEVDSGGDAQANADGGVVVSVLPETLLLDGTAEAEDGDDRVECRFFGMLTDSVREPNGEISGLFIGEIFRTTFTGGGQFEFAPLVGGPAT